MMLKFKQVCTALFVLIACSRAEAQIATTNNPHGAIKIACSNCHTTKGWSPLRPDIKFKHEETGFVLEGQHALVECKQCHASLKFSNTPTACKVCHDDPHDGKHGSECTRCHTIHSWQDISKITFVHQASRFPLLGRHQHVGCDNCHVAQNENRFVNVPLNCAACHFQEYESTENPNHKLAGFPLRCEMCHSSAITSWENTSFVHTPRFPLVFGHAINSCVACHFSGFRGTSSACFSCHEADYQQTTNPNHMAGNFSHECQVCHNTVAWKGAFAVDHDRTRFPLTGAHRAVACDLCHVNNRFAGTPLDCFSCHQKDFQRPTNPNHVAGNFSRTCTTCHTTSAWQPSIFDHNKTRFPLQGAHLAVACNSCHLNNRFAGTPADCYSCHQVDFQRPTSPNHMALNFSHDCTTCHTVNAWKPSTFDHDGRYFRIYSGKHRGKWQTCATCHVNPANYKIFECLNCHEHNQQRMDDRHRGKPGYQYNSAACYNCHPGA
ncbi:MAG: hypothetical protein ONB44_07600 [candidate division KSB1 bacterium]|nr:hypothetical protein [candidate division KSB1 bacterium]MDZ7301991.1 hypothetical protein [candidate division KSB1 bacterium]MDZ7310173.1 hypothetical protein [candidate division KSB1 bacterium]